MKYIAKTKHKDPCDLCGCEILPGDAVRGWCWTNEEGPGGARGYGGICRTHETCYVIGSREDAMDERVRTFEQIDEDRYNNCAEEDEHKLETEALDALKAWRAAHPTTERSLDEAVALLRDAVTMFEVGQRMDKQNEICAFLRRFK